MAKKIIEKMFEAPAQMLDGGMKMAEKAEKQIVNKKPFKAAEEYWETLGPGLTTGAADDDPSGIATYSQAGAQYGFQLLWLSLFTFPFMAIVQEMCARIGLVTGQGLAANIKKHYSRKVLLFCTALLFVANTLNIGADLGAMVEGIRLLFPQISFGVAMAAFVISMLLLQIYTTYARYSKYLKYLAFVLFSYVFSALAVKLNWSDALRHTVIPSMTFGKDQIILICGILGTTISPYLFFWQTSQEVEEEILKGEKTIKQRKDSVTPQEIRSLRIDVWSGMFFSNVVMFFIIAACGATLFVSGITTIGSAAQAAQALRPFAGESAYVLFALGIIGTGLLAIPVLAGSASYAIAESFGWKYGLYRKLKDAYAFYGVIIISMLIGTGMNFLHINPIKALLYSAVANGLVAPFILFFIVRISSNEKVMGKRVNGKIIAGLGWLITILMVIAGIATVWSIFG
ncbi:MAG: divalent metal cation transporter [Candidatus Peregrinibacteria bacterium]|nr:divalent metal cation transporter [Candidatus Peregrinibacteria bacterium]